MKMEVGATKADNSRGCIIFCSTNFSFYYKKDGLHTKTIVALAGMNN